MNAERAEAVVDWTVRAILLEAGLSLIVPAILFALVMGLAWALGRWADRRHLAHLARDEAELRAIPATNLPRASGAQGDEATVGVAGASGARMVSGSVVVANNRFKMWRAGWRALIGGEITHYEVLVGRARREAMVRMKREAARLGAREVCGVRLQATSVGMSRGGSASGIEVIAYGTALI